MSIKRYIFLLLGFAISVSVSKAQNNFLDSYIGTSVTSTLIGSSSNQVNEPRDLDFKPNSHELWIVNYGTGNGGENVVFYNAGLPNQSSKLIKDTHTSHFMVYPNALAFGDDGRWACVSEIQNTSSPTSTFMGPALWSGDTAITGSVFQNNWIGGLPLGSHLDMLHQSPYAMGIAHDSAGMYWVLDGHNGNICKYDFTQDHGPGYDNHNNGKIWRYSDVTFSRVPNMPSHIVLDKASGWLYFIDGGTKTLKRMNTNTGAFAGILTVPSTSNEVLASYQNFLGATVETLDSFTTQPCGVDYYNGRLIVSDNTTGDIYLYNTTSPVTLIGTIVTGHPGMTGVKVGPDGKIWCVNNTESKVYRLDAGTATLDASLITITSPVVQNHLSNFYSTGFNVCNGSITPSATISNTGSTTITSMQIDFAVDGGAHTIFNWTGTLTAGNSTTVTLPNGIVTNGPHQLDILIMTVNGVADNVDLNNRLTGSFRAINPPVSLPLTEGFLSTTFPPSGWNYVQYNPNNKMTRFPSGGFGNSVGSMKMNNFTGNTDISGQQDHLISPMIDLSSASPSHWLSFSVAHAQYDSSTNDQLEVFVSTDCGMTWISIYDKAGSTLATTPSTSGAFSPNSDRWRSDSVNLSAYAGQSNVLLKFTTTSDFGNNIYIDDILLGEFTVNLEEGIAGLTTHVIPNPSSDGIQFMINAVSPSEGTICITDIVGKQVATVAVKLQTGQNQFDLQPYFETQPGGSYFVSLKTNHSTLTHKIIRF